VIEGRGNQISRNFDDDDAVTIFQKVGKLPVA
jgi:hypothetical protein